jgi:hypothetical protein
MHGVYSLVCIHSLYPLGISFRFFRLTVHLTKICFFVVVDIVLDVTFNGVTMTEYQSDVTEFENTVTQMVNI